MKKSQFTESQIIAMLKQHEQGIKVQDIARANGISEKTIYRWKVKYGGMDVAASTVKFAAMGAMAGPIGAGVGAVVGLGVGLIKKNKFEKEARKAETKRKSTLQNKEDQALSRGEAAEFFESQAGATAGAYGVGDIDRFTNKYS